MSTADAAALLHDAFEHNDMRGCLKIFMAHDCLDDEAVKALVFERAKLARQCRNAAQFLEVSGITGLSDYEDHRRIYELAEWCLGRLNARTAAAGWGELAQQLYTIAKRHGDAWIREWCVYLKENCNENWWLLHQFFLDGLCERPDDETYYLGLMAGIPRSDLQMSLEDFVRQHPDLLEYDIWKFFEIEGNDVYSLAKCEHNTGWREILVRLAGEGVIGRGALLKATLQAMGRSFRTYRLRWHCKLHDELKPTPEERLALKDDYLHLCNSGSDPVLSIAVRGLVVVQQRHPLTADELLQVLPSALGSKPKGTVGMALALLDCHLQDHAERREELLSMLCGAFCHEAADVQQRTLDLLQRHDAFSCPAVCATLEEYADLLAPSIKVALPQAHARTSDASSLDVEALVEQANALPQEWQRRLDIAPCLEALASGRLCTQPLDLKQIPLLTDAASADFVPLASLDELMDSCQHYLQDPIDLLLAERIFEAIGRFGHQQNKAFEQQAGPLLQQARRALESDDELSLLPEFCAVVVAWISGDVVSLYEPESSLHRLWVQRCAEIADRAARRQPFVLASTPTHGHRLSPAVLRERLSQGTFPAADLAFALLRLAPFDAAVIKQVQQQGSAGSEVDQIVRILRHAGPVWTASVHLERKQYSYHGYSDPRDCWTAAETDVELVAELVDLRASFLNCTPGQAATPFALLGTTFPLHPEIRHVIIGSHAAANHATTDAFFSRRLGYEHLDHPDLPFGPTAWFMLAICLFCADDVVRELAGDLLSDAIDDGRLGAEGAQWMLASMCRSGLATCKRITPAINAAAAAGPLQVAVLRDGILGALPQIETWPRDSFALLQSLHDLMVLSGAAVEHGAARLALASINGSSKVAKLAKSLLAVQATPHRALFDRQATAAALAARLRRFERQRSRDGS